MSRLIWKIREFVMSLLPLALVVGVLYGGWTLYKKGTFRKGITPAVSSVLGKIPVFGSHFRQQSYSSPSVARSSSKARRHHHRRGRRHHHRRHHR